jgi:hypothetical protein
LREDVNFLFVPTNLLNEAVLFIFCGRFRCHYLCCFCRIGAENPVAAAANLPEAADIKRGMIHSPGAKNNYLLHLFFALLIALI